MYDVPISVATDKTTVYKNLENLTTTGTDTFFKDQIEFFFTCSSCVYMYFFPFADTSTFSENTSAACFSDSIYRSHCTCKFDKSDEF